MDLTSDELRLTFFYLAAWFVYYALAYLSLLFYIALTKNQDNATRVVKSCWPVMTRCLSISHAIVVCVKVLYLLSNCPLTQVLDISFCGPDAVNATAEINIIMMTYLVVDLLFVMLRKRLIMSTEAPEPYDWSNIGHHVVGSVCMYAFIVNRVLRINSLFYAATEISTIPLHISWIIKWMLESKEQLSLRARQVLRLLLFVFAILTWLTFFVFRIVGSYLMIGWLILHAAYIREYSPAIIFFVIVGNAALFCLNNLWFYRLTCMMMFNRKPKTKTD